jgi:hypothetical protein
LILGLQLPVTQACPGRAAPTARVERRTAAASYQGPDASSRSGRRLPACRPRSFSGVLHVAKLRGPPRHVRVQSVGFPESGRNALGPPHEPLLAHRVAAGGLRGGFCRRRCEGSRLDIVSRGHRLANPTRPSVVVVRFGLDDLVLLAEVTFQPAGWLRSGRDWNAPVTFVTGGAIGLPWSTKRPGQRSAVTCRRTVTDL